MNIYYLENIEIDKKKWDSCITGSYNGIIYAHSWYLDIVSPGWCALIADEYKYVMPLPVKRKYGFNYIVQTLYMQQGGIFTTETINDSLIYDFIGKIPDKYKYILINFNVFTKTNRDLFKYNSGLTMHLDLIKPYKQLYSSYSANTKRNIKEALKYDCSFVKNINPLVLIKMLKQSNIKGIQKLTNQQLDTLKTLIEECRRRRVGDLYGITDKSGNIIASAFFAGTHNKTINIANISSSAGYSQKAMFLLFDSYFQSAAGSQTTFDFEGSSIPGIARFYKGFGARSIEFPILHINRLPFLVKMLKK